MAYDRDVKAPISAAAGIPEDWLPDLGGNTAWRYRAPHRDGHQEAETLTLTF